VYRHDIGHTQEFVQILCRRYRTRKIIGIEVGVVGNDVHTETEGSAGDATCDAPEAEQPERFAGELDAGELGVVIPGGGSQVGFAALQVLRHGQHQHHGVLRG
jgi:hypothetical protein